MDQLRHSFTQLSVGEADFHALGCAPGTWRTVAKLEIWPGGLAENSPRRESGVQRKQMFSPEGAAQFILRNGFSVAPSGLSSFVILTPGSRPGLFSTTPSGLE
jgi:hypothetical protein